MKITSSKGIDLIKKYEGFSATVYRCAANVPTIGYGATYYPDGKKVTMQDEPITESYAEFMLTRMLRDYENGVNRYVQTDINQNQFDALVSFAYNLGLGALKSSTLLKKVNIDPNDPTIPDEFKKWVKAGGKILNGLVKRRSEEAELYFS
jgi:lysozyme